MSKFCDPYSYFLQRNKKRQNWKEYYQEVLRNNPIEKCKMRAACESIWYGMRRPYYRIFPSVLNLFRGVKLDLAADLVVPPLKSLLIQLPDNMVKSGKTVLHNILINKLSKDEVKKVGTSLHFYFSTFGNQCCAALIAPQYSDIKLEFILTESHELAKIGLPMLPDDLLTDAIRFYATICLLADDPELVEPDVLDNDKAEWEATKDWELQKKAIKRGKFGFNVGSNIEKSPHFRNGCMALYHTGEGRRIPKIRWRSHSIVHSPEIKKIPQGYMDDEALTIS